MIKVNKFDGTFIGYEREESEDFIGFVNELVDYYNNNEGKKMKNTKEDWGIMIDPEKLHLKKFGLLPGSKHGLMLQFWDGNIVWIEGHTLTMVRNEFITGKEIVQKTLDKDQELTDKFIDDWIFEVYHNTPIPEHCKNREIRSVR